MASHRARGEKENPNKTWAWGGSWHSILAILMLALYEYGKCCYCRLEDESVLLIYVRVGGLSCCLSTSRPYFKYVSM